MVGGRGSWLQRAPPPYIIDKIARDMGTIMRAELAETMRGRGAEPNGAALGNFKYFFAMSFPKWARMAQQAGVRLN